MKKLLSRGLATGAAGLLVAVASSSAVSAQAMQPSTTMAAATTYQANVTSLNNSGASGTALITVNGKDVTVDVRATGLAPNLAHAQHLHVGGKAACPAPAADTNKDGVVSAKEAEVSVGPIKVALTTIGDTSPASALAVDRMPKADAKGVLTYKRTFSLPAGVTAADMAKASIEMHGVSALSGDKTKYDGDKRSELDTKLAFEVTAPAACGVLASTPLGGPDTGIGSTAGIEAVGSIVFGIAALAGAALLVAFGRRPITPSASNRD